MDDSLIKKKMKIRLFGVFIITLLIILACSHYLASNQKKSEQMKVKYTARTTVSRIESRLDKYLERADFIKKIIEKANNLDDKKFNEIAELLHEDKDVIEAIELAKDGVVGNIYPLKGNEPAMGLDMLTNPKRKKEAKIAKKSGQYTIAGPYELKQGGIGALLFDPVYIYENGHKKFWGFVILVIDWEKFIHEINLNNLEDIGYDYQIWKKNLSEGTEVTIAQGNCKHIIHPLEVVCKVPNDTWYFEIAPKS
ncbi:CHASE domain-containing protein [Eubacterium sp. MSJ-13]|uniref:CHASE domain-containing protein n=1 Tax=Eubacterium sp. MSJ-13 TaxID=2841513 RepID=UPI001C0FA1CF|nr:CHASE domain-containing protein [Eubacterium sp. MSJ-13]MBU5478595.1 CHASE domain-containing protein [Eubacterium sp. MSJ-13]